MALLEAKGLGIRFGGLKAVVAVLSLQGNQLIN